MENHNKNDQIEVKAKKPRGRPKTEDPAYKKDDYKEQKKAYAKEYYAKNKENMLKSMKEKIECSICKKMVSRTNMVPHMKTRVCKYAKYYRKEIIQITEDNVVHVPEVTEPEKL